MLRLLTPLLLFVSFASWSAPKVVFETTLGSFTVELNQEKAPISVANFIKYVEDGSYVGSQFHRVIPGFMAQGGGFDKEMNRLPTYAPIKNEGSNGLANATATIAMARTNNPDSATRQFFINLNDNNFLDATQRPPGYAVFGKVSNGFEVVQDMATKPTRNVGRMADVPAEAIVITKVTLLK
ncbi:peptidylprolyl isomerase [Vibrio makurazakiensis]|uniref:peptidylprolyl isomerase n=1 Tax=Vibrio makurazakiensis TaxID=2910250 RepID=UPI003D0F8E25